MGRLLALLMLIALPASAGETFKDCELCPEMTVVPAGDFTMGTPPEEAAREKLPEVEAARETPRHGVAIPQAFALGVFEVTLEQWHACEDEGICAFGSSDTGLGSGRHPVANVSWEEVQTYLDWLSKKTGKPYRLPTEAEWEWAARAGTDAARYWGDDRARACGHENVHDQASENVAHHNVRKVHHKCDDGQIFSAPVGSYAPNAFGLHDMLGNAREWVADCWHESYDGAPTDGSAWTEGGNCMRRVVRGGDWLALPRFARSGRRAYLLSVVPMGNVGFRVALSLK